jgi:hypothetical protein
MSTSTLWERLAAPIPPERIFTREERGEILRYINGNTVRERLDEVAPGWSFSITPLETTTERIYSRKEEKYIDQPLFHYLGRLMLAVDGSFGVTRENIGSGRSPKAAASDAFKRTAVSFGIAQELYEKEGRPNLGDQQPSRRPARQAPADPGLPRALRDQAGDDEPFTPENAPHSPRPKVTSADVGDNPACPKCGGRVWDNRDTKRNPKAPDFKCRNRSCDGVIWPPKNGKPVTSVAVQRAFDEAVDSRPAALEDDDEIPF